MRFYKTHFIVFIVGALLGICAGFFTGKAIYDRTIDESIVRDTIVVYDTIPDYHPMPKDSAHIKWVTRFLPIVKTDTFNHFVEVSKMIHDTVAVEVPITSKHYSGKNYDAYVSGFETNLDSIFVYNETQYVTETITKEKQPSKWELDIIGGIDYNVTSQRYTPFAGGELLYKPNRLQVGIRGGVSRTDKTEPFVGGIVKIKVF